jgi:hypothetical protein
MKTTEISVNISKKIGRTGEFGSDMVSASITKSIDDESEIKNAYNEAWSIVKEEVKEQEELLAEKKVMKEVADSIGTEVAPVTAPVYPIPPIVDPDPIMTSTAPICDIHHVVCVWKPAGISKRTGKAYAGFYSCPNKMPDGSYCTFKPK